SVTLDAGVSTYRDRHGRTWIVQGRLGADHALGARVLGPPAADGSRATFDIPSVIGVLHLFEPAAGSEDAVWARDFVRVYRLDSREAGVTHAECVASAPDVRDALVDRAGALWVVSSRGLERVVGADRTLFGVKDGLPTDQARSLCEDANGTLWIGTYGGG